MIGRLPSCLDSIFYLIIFCVCAPVMGHASSVSEREGHAFCCINADQRIPTPAWSVELWDTEVLCVSQALSQGKSG